MFVLFYGHKDSVNKAEKQNKKLLILVFFSLIRNFAPRNEETENTYFIVGSLANG